VITLLDATLAAQAAALAVASQVADTQTELLSNLASATNE
jgi:hypothetical protein